ncbi:undecaprenyl-diphosphate phosphatase [Candidatus Uhrbacteria bacterium]|nr:undecaprenyl-diphosphate phosphatase [Candidatus Uhrbacteria bacterium]
MTMFQALTLGIVQGITEFLPISSSGFLILVPEALGWPVQDLAFDAFMHLATLTAVIVALWSEVAAIVGAFRAPRQEGSGRWRRLGVWIVLSTIPVLVIGYALKDVIEGPLRSTEVVAWSFIIWGTVLYLADRRAKRPKDAVTSVSPKQMFLVGLSQAIALIPGTSRSGITITSGLFLGLSRETAARFSFLLALPATAAAGLYKLLAILDGSVVIAIQPLVVGFLAAFFTALLTIKLLLAFLKRYSFSEVAVFRVLVGFLILLLG